MFKNPFCCYTGHSRPKLIIAIVPDTFKGKKETKFHASTQGDPSHKNRCCSWVLAEHWCAAQGRHVTTTTLKRTALARDSVVPEDMPTTSDEPGAQQRGRPGHPQAVVCHQLSISCVTAGFSYTSMALLVRILTTLLNPACEYFAMIPFHQLRP